MVRGKVKGRERVGDCVDDRREKVIWRRGEGEGESFQRFPTHLSSQIKLGNGQSLICVSTVTEWPGDYTNLSDGVLKLPAL